MLDSLIAVSPTLRFTSHAPLGSWNTSNSSTIACHAHNTIAGSLESELLGGKTWLIGQQVLRTRFHQDREIFFTTIPHYVTPSPFFPSVAFTIRASPACFSRLALVLGGVIVGLLTRLLASIAFVLSYHLGAGRSSDSEV